MFSGLMLHVIPGQILLIVSGVSKAVALLFFALMPEQPNYWAWVLPALIFETACLDILWTVSNVYLTSSLPKKQQGIAGALINFTLFIGSAFFVGIADIAASELKKKHMKLKDLYQYIFWLGFGVACVALLITLFIRLGRAGCRLTHEEEAEIARASSDSKGSRIENAEHRHLRDPDARGIISTKAQQADQRVFGPPTAESDETAVMDWVKDSEANAAGKMANVTVSEVFNNASTRGQDAR